MHIALNALKIIVSSCTHYFSVWRWFVKCLELHLVCVESSTVHCKNKRFSNIDTLYLPLWKVSTSTQIRISTQVTNTLTKIQNIAMLGLVFLFSFLILQPSPLFNPLHPSYHMQISLLSFTVVPFNCSCKRYAS